MRLWHKDLIPALPRKQLLGQWRECCLIAKGLHDGSLNHLLVNKVKDYPLKQFCWYAGLVAAEMNRRGYKCNDKVFAKYFKTPSSALASMVYYYDAYKIPYREQLFDGWHNDRYLRQCLYNLQEKYDCGGIAEDEWTIIIDAFGNRISV